MLALAGVPIFFTHIFPWPFIFVGGSFAYTAVRDIIRAVSSYRWPTVEGKVVLTKVEVTDTGGDYPHDLFYPVIEYSYAIDAVTKTSRKLAMADINPGSRARAEAILSATKQAIQFGFIFLHKIPRSPSLSPACGGPCSAN